MHAHNIVHYCHKHVLCCIHHLQILQTLVTPTKLLLNFSLKLHLPAANIRNVYTVLDNICCFALRFHNMIAFRPR